jgi:hypothetical protein
MPALTALISTENIPCTCCGCPAEIGDEQHGPLCRECLQDLLAIQDYLDALELQ